MNSISKSFLVVAIVMVAASSFAAQRPARQVIVTGGASTNCFARPSGTNAPPALINGATIATHLATTYAAVVSYDANTDGQLDETEQSDLATAIAGGTFLLSGRTNAPAGTNCLAPPAPNADMSTHLAAHLAAEYAVIAPFDLNHDSTLDDTEQAALAEAIVAGTVTLPMPPRHGGHH